MFGAGAEKVCVTICKGGAALGKEAEDLGTKRTVEARAMVFLGAAVGREADELELGMGPWWKVKLCCGDGGMGWFGRTDIGEVARAGNLEPQERV